MHVGDRCQPRYPERSCVRRLELSGLESTAAASRNFTRAAMSAWGLGSPHGDEPEDVDPMDDVLLSVSELVTNACRHGGGARLLELVWTPPRRLHVEVFDTSPRLPVPRFGQPLESAGGYGLQVLGLLCDRWGVTSRREVPGKSVWAELEPVRRRR